MRVTEDARTRRVIDMQSDTYRVGVAGANALIEGQRDRLELELMTGDWLMEELLTEDPDLNEGWGMYVLLKACTDTLRDFLQEQGT